jgi:hypothetical protein
VSERFYSLSEVARQLKILPRVLSDAFYQRLLDDERCQMVGGRRLIPESYLPELEAVVREIAKRKKRNPRKSLCR